MLIRIERSRPIRINELARELEVKSGEILKALPDLGVEGTKSHSSSVDDATAAKLRDRFKGRQRSEPEPEPVDLDLPQPRRLRRVDARPAPRASRGHSASVRPTIPRPGLSASPVKPPVGGFRPPVRPPSADAAAKPAPSVPTKAPPAAAAVPDAKAKPLEEAVTAEPATGEEAKPEPPVTLPTGPEIPRPAVSLPPGQPKKAPTAPPKKAPRIPTPKPAGRSNGAAAAGATVPKPPTTAVPGTRRPGPVNIPGAPRPAPVARPKPKPPVVPPQQTGVRYVGRTARPGASPGSGPPKIHVPGQPEAPRGGLRPRSPMPGTPTPGPPTGGPRPGGPGYGYPRPPGAGPPMGRPPGGPPGRGRGPGGGRRPPRAQQPRRRDAETGEEAKIAKRTVKHEPPKAVNTEIFASAGISIKELADKLGIKANQVLKTLVEKGERSNINQPLDLDRIKEISSYFGATAEEMTPEEEAVLDIDQEEDVEDVEDRPPVVTVMGHVDHGKTSLLDAIRSSNVAGREAGGITQAIGAYQVEREGKRIVFIDTPGHEAFTKMRAHGASVTDVVVLVVAADDGVMPQTIEAIDHAKLAKVPIVVAVNKIDLPKSEPDKVKQQLSDRGLVPEDWGGDTIFCHVSAKTQEGIDDLLSTISLVAEVRELKANPARRAIGVVLEAKLDRGKGPTATVLTQNGTLRVGDTFVVGSVRGKVRALMNDTGRQTKEAGPSSAVVVLGLDDLPEPGDQLTVIADTDRASKIVEYRQEKARELAMAQSTRLSLEQFQEQLADGRAKELPIIIKADFQGSATMLQDTLAKLTSDKVRVRVIHTGVGAIKESDILLAVTARAIVVGFNVRPERSAATLAEKDGIDIRLHTVIYDLVDELKLAMAGLLDPIRKEEILGRATVLEVFQITNVGTVAGCKLEEGVAQSQASARLLRDNAVVHTGRLASLRRFKDDVKEVRAGQECGMHFERYNDVKPSDEIEIFKTIELAQDINELITI